MNKIDLSHIKLKNKTPVRNNIILKQRNKISPFMSIQSFVYRQLIIKEVYSIDINDLWNIYCQDDKYKSVITDAKINFTIFKEIAEICITSYNNKTLSQLDDKTDDQLKIFDLL